MVDKVTITMQHPEADETIEVLPASVENARARGWEPVESPPRHHRPRKRQAKSFDSENSPE